MKKQILILIIGLLYISIAFTQTTTFNITVDSTQVDNESLSFVDLNWRYVYTFIDTEGRQVRMVEEYTQAEKDSVFQLKVDVLQDKINTLIIYRDDCDAEVLRWQKRKQSLINKGKLLIRKRDKYQNAIGL